jgi:hypothetical protein
MALQMKLPASERATAAFRKLATSTQELNESNSEWSTHIESINIALRKLGLRVSAWHEIAGGADDEEYSFWSREIGWTKIDDDWCLAIRKSAGDVRMPDEAHEETWRFQDAPHYMRIDAGSKIADLLEALVKRTEETTAKVAKRKIETAELAERLQALTAEIDANKAKEK